MSRRHFSTLLIATIIVALAVTLLVPGKTGRDQTLSTGLLLPQVAPGINEVNEVRIALGGGVTAATLRRDAGQWRIGELNGYPADWEELRELLRGLAQAEIVEYKTSNPDYYARLGVEEISAPDAAGLLLEVVLGGERHGVIVGNEASGRDGQYVRLAGAEQSALIDRVLDVPTDLIDWADRDVVDVAAYLVTEVEIIHPDGGWVLIHKASANDTDFVLQEMPEGREPVSSWGVNSLAGIFSGLRMDSVLPDDGSPRPGAVKIRLLTFAGVEYLAEAWAEQDSYWLRLQAAVLAGPFAPEADEAGKAAAEKNAAQAAAVNARSSGWVFEMPESDFVAMTKRMDDLLKPLESESQAGP